MERTTRLLLDEPPAEATRLVLASLGRIAESTNFVNLALSFIPADDFPRVVEAALARLRADYEDGNAADVIAWPQLLPLRPTFISPDFSPGGRKSGPTPGRAGNKDAQLETGRRTGRGWDDR